MIGQALGEFQISLTFADAPIDLFARGDIAAMTDSQKRGALLFFGEAKCSVISKIMFWVCLKLHLISESEKEMFCSMAKIKMKTSDQNRLAENLKIALSSVHRRFEMSRCNRHFFTMAHSQDWKMLLAII